MIGNLQLIDNSWKPFFDQEVQKEYFLKLNKQIRTISSNGTLIFPPEAQIFHAFELCSFSQLKVILLGQDPYHKINQAMGLSFSVPKSQKIPASLRNIYKELHNDLGIEIPKHGDLTSWATQGVLLINSVMTVNEGKPGSHKKFGWEIFTDELIRYISNNKEHLVFLLWGNFAKSKRDLIDANKHLILEAAHPSPLARGAFFGSRHFSQTNKYLRLHHKSEINWILN